MEKIIKLLSDSQEKIFFIQQELIEKKEHFIASDISSVLKNLFDIEKKLKKDYGVD